MRPRTIRGIRNIADYCGTHISRYVVTEALRNGDLPTVGDGKWNLVRTEDVDAWLLRYLDPTRTKDAS